MNMPLEALKTLLDMVTGKIEFQLGLALDAIGDVLKYAATFADRFPSAEVAVNSASVLDLDAEQIMRALISEEGGNVFHVLNIDGTAAFRLFDKIPKEVALKLLTSFLLKWLSRNLI